MFNLDEEKIEFAHGNTALVFWQGKKAENVSLFLYDVEIRGSYLSLTLGTANQTSRLIMFFKEKVCIP